MKETASNGRTEEEVVREQLRAWFEQFGWTIEDRAAEEGQAWRLQARNRAGQRVVAVQQSDRPDIVILGGSVVPGGPHAQKLAARAPAGMRGFLWELRFELLRQHYQFQIQGPGIKRVAFTRVIYWDEGVRRSQFANAVEEIHHGVLTVQWMIQRLLDEPPPPEPVRVVGPGPIN
jgi:hypothetical protein